MDLLEFIDFKFLFILVTVRLWLPVAKILLRAVNPYPHWIAPPHLRLNAPEGPQLDDTLESEEWAVWRLRREREANGETLPELSSPSSAPRLKRMTSDTVRTPVGVRRSA